MAHRVLISGQPTKDNPSGLRSNTFTAGNGGDITVAPQKSSSKQVVVFKLVLKAKGELEIL